MNWNILLYFLFGIASNYEVDRTSVKFTMILLVLFQKKQKLCWTYFQTDCIDKLIQ